MLDRAQTLYNEQDVNSLPFIAILFAKNMYVNSIKRNNSWYAGEVHTSKMCKQNFSDQEPGIRWAPWEHLASCFFFHYRKETVQCLLIAKLCCFRQLEILFCCTIYNNNGLEIIFAKKIIETLNCLCESIMCWR